MSPKIACSLFTTFKIVRYLKDGESLRGPFEGYPVPLRIL